MATMSWTCISYKVTLCFKKLLAIWSSQRHKNYAQKAPVVCALRWIWAAFYGPIGSFMPSVHCCLTLPAVWSTLQPDRMIYCAPSLPVRLSHPTDNDTGVVRTRQRYSQTPLLLVTDVYILSSFHRNVKHTLRIDFVCCRGEMKHKKFFRFCQICAFCRQHRWHL